VWSVWSEDIHLYLGQGMALLQIGHGPVQVLGHARTLPLGRVLAQVAQAIPEDGARKRLRRSALSVTLSGALCPAMGFQAPAEVTRWHELRQVACASAASTMDVGPDQILCEISGGQPGLCATVAGGLMMELMDWAEERRFRLASVQPLWALASQCPMARQGGVHGLLVREPDACTLLAQSGSGQLAATTLTGAYDGASVQAHARRWLLSQGLSEVALLHLNFGEELHSVMPQGPKAWAAHWSGT